MSCGGLIINTTLRMGLLSARLRAIVAQRESAKLYLLLDRRKACPVNGGGNA